MNKLNEIDKELFKYSIEQRCNAKTEYEKQKYSRRLEELLNICYDEYMKNKGV